MAIALRCLRKNVLPRVTRLSLAAQFGTINPVKSDLSSDLESFRKILKEAKSVVALTGAGISAESGISTHRGPGLVKNKTAPRYATLRTFNESPALVWEFYASRRDYVVTRQPNPAHLALAELEKRLKVDGKNLTVITQNIDELHRRAGSENLIELHGNLFKTLCTKCQSVDTNHDFPICAALEDRERPEPDAIGSDIPIADLPHCKKENCNGLLRPYVVWFGESVPQETLEKAKQTLESCDLCLVIGTSSVVYPAAMFAPKVAKRGVPVAEFNLEPTARTKDFGFHFAGPCGETLPKAIS